MAAPGSDHSDVIRSRARDRSEDLPVRRQVAGPAAAAVHPRRRGRRLPLAAVVKQIEFSTTMALDRPASGRIFSGQLIRDNLGIGRPDKVNIVFGRMMRYLVGAE
jgi:hypothetical protein